jgi:hypothetical protein
MPVALPSFVPAAIARKLAGFSPRSDVGKFIRACLPHLPADMAGELIDKFTSILILESSLAVVHLSDFDPNLGIWHRADDYGIVSRKVVTTAGVNYLVDCWQNLQTLSTMRCHAIGTSANAENIADTGCVAEIATGTYTALVRATGTLEEGATANIFRSAGTNQVAAGVTLVEHMLMNTNTRGLGTGWDRSVWGGTTISASDAILTRYDLTGNAGG